MKTSEELDALKNQIETLNCKFAELSREELEQVTGGITHAACLRKVRMDFYVDGQEYGEQHTTN